MLKRLQSTGALTAKVQRPDYAASIFKGGRVTIEASEQGYILGYKSPEGFSHLAKGWKAGEEEAMLEYLLKLADEGRWKTPQTR